MKHICKNCKYYEPKPKLCLEFQSCQPVSDDELIIECAERLEVGSNFGCIHFKQKQNSK